MGYHGASSRVPVDVGLPAPVGVREHLVPLSIAALYRGQVGAFGLYGGLGPSLTIAYVKVGPEAQSNAVAGLELLAGNDFALGPGRLIGEVSGGFSRLKTRSVQVRTSGIVFLVGYRYFLR